MGVRDGGREAGERVAIGAADAVVKTCGGPMGRWRGGVDGPGVGGVWREVGRDPVAAGTGGAAGDGAPERKWWVGGCESWRGVVRGDALEAAAPCDGEAGDQDQESSRVWARGVPGTDVERDAWAGRFTRAGLFARAGRVAWEVAERDGEEPAELGPRVGAV